MLRCDTCSVATPLAVIYQKPDIPPAQATFIEQPMESFCTRTAVHVEFYSVSIRTYQISLANQPCEEVSIVVACLSRQEVSEGVVLLKVFIRCSNEHIQLVDHDPTWRSIYTESSGNKVNDRGRRQKLLTG